MTAAGAVFRADFRRRLDELALGKGEREALFAEARTELRAVGTVIELPIAQQRRWGRARECRAAMAP